MVNNVKLHWETDRNHWDDAVISEYLSVTQEHLSPLAEKINEQGGVLNIFLTYSFQWNVTGVDDALAIEIHKISLHLDQ